MVAVLGLVVVAEAALSYQRNQLYGGSALGIWKDTAEKSPGKCAAAISIGVRVLSGAALR